jgi:hypothetical protein
VAKRLVITVDVKPANTTHFEPTVGATDTRIARHVFVVAPSPFKLAGMLVQRRQQAGLFGVADEFKTSVATL